MINELAYYRSALVLQNGTVLEPHYYRVVKNREKAICSNDFEMIKVIGKGGFSKVFMGIH